MISSRNEYRFNAIMMYKDQDRNHIETFFVGCKVLKMLIASRCFILLNAC